jgi:hypothetical protein
MLAPEKADTMRTALAFVKAIRNHNWYDAGYLCQTMIHGDKNDPMGNFAQSMAAMATLLCNELDITDEWVDMRIAAITHMEARGDL